MGLAYKSVRLISVNNAKLACVYYVLIVVLLAYVIGYSIIYEKGYQKYYPLTGSSLLKVKGSAKLPGRGGVYDANDLAVPPLMPDTAFVGTCFLHTPNQKRGLCAAPEVPCTTPKDCDDAKDNIKATEFGALTGACKEYLDLHVQGNQTHFCEIESWCPLEPQQNATEREMSTVAAAQNWTVFARVNVDFADLDITLSNVGDQIEPGVNLFTVRDIVERAGSTYEEIASEGCMIVVQFSYDCDFNYGTSCLPSVSFDRIDVDDPKSISRGFNYRFQTKTRTADNDSPNSVSRDLWKIRGVYIVFKVVGQGGMFDLTTTMIALGAGLSFLAIATVVCDFLMVHCIAHKEEYQKFKHREVESYEDTDLNFGDITDIKLAKGLLGRSEIN